MTEAQAKKLLRDGLSYALPAFALYHDGDGFAWLADGRAGYRVPAEWLAEEVAKAPPSVVTEAERIGREVPRTLCLIDEAVDTLPFTEVAPHLADGVQKRLGGVKARTRLRYCWLAGDIYLPIFVLDAQGDPLAFALCQSVQGQSLPPQRLALEPVAPDPFALLRAEKEVLGTYLSAHPLQLLPSLAGATHLLAECAAAGTYTCAVLVESVTSRRTQAGQKFLVASVSDLSGQAEVVMWPRALAHQTLTEQTCVLVRLSVSVGEERTTISVTGVEPLTGIEKRTRVRKAE